MNIISRYIFGQTASALLMITGALSGIVWIAVALRQLNVVTSQGQGATTLLAMTSLALPNLMAIIAPFAFLIAMLYTLNRLSSDSELIVLTASGAPVWTVLRPLLVLAGILSVLLAITAHFVQPWSMRQLKAYTIEVRKDLLTQVIQPGRFSSPESGLTFHIRDRAPNGDLLGLIMHDTRKEQESQSYLARRGVIIEQDNGAFLYMTDGHILRRANATDAAQIVAFDNYAISLDAFAADDTPSNVVRPRERYFSELWNPDPKEKYVTRYAGLIRAELHERMISPFYPIIFALIVVAIVGQARSTRTGQTEALVMAFVVAAGLRLVGLALNNLSGSSPAFLPLVYVVPIGAGVLALMAIRRGRQMRAESAWLDKIRTLWERLRSWRGRKGGSDSSGGNGGGVGDAMGNGSTMVRP